MYKKIVGEAITLLKFGVVGLSAAVVHLSIALSLISYANIQPLHANFIAFLCAFLLSFSGHLKWTFSAEGRRRGAAFIKFFVITFTAFLANNIVLFGLVERKVMSDQWAVCIAVTIIPVISFLGSRLWAFK